MKRFLSWWCFLSCAVLASLALAQPAPDTFFQRHDTDKDGKLSLEEFPEKVRKNFNRLDTNSDGFVSRTEYERIVERNRRRQEQRNRQPARTPTHADVRYGPAERNVLDLYLAPGDGPHPLVVFFHGGGFRGGDKSRINPKLIDALHAKGISYASGNYRLTQTAPFPAPMHDAARAIQFIRLHAAEYALDPDRIAVTGGSAGAGISLWLAFHDDLADPKSDDPVLRQSSRVCTAIPVAGQSTYDPRVIAKLFNSNQIHPALYAFYGMEESEDINTPKYFPLYEEASAITHLSKDDPPVLMLYTQPDTPMPPNSTGHQYIHHPEFGRYLKKAADKIGVTCEVRLRSDWKTTQERNEGMAAWFEEHLLQKAEKP